MIAGHDISFLPELEATGHTFSDAKGTRPLEYILADAGATHVRLRLWVEPPVPYCNLAYTLAMARRVRDAGMKLLLDLHYCDFWADPAKQPTPAAWRDLDLATLADTVREYTANVVRALDAQGTPPDIVQVGNEITNGMLWPQGKIERDAPEEWDALATLLRAGVAGVEVGSAGTPRTMIHIDRGGDNAGSRHFFDRILERGVQFDLIGLSYYPWWHGPLQDLEANLQDLAARYDRDIVLVETAYPWSPPHEGVRHAATGDVVHSTHHPATPEGQRDFLRSLDDLLRATPRNHGAGLVYWESAWLAGVEWEPGGGNGWTHLTLFDQAGKALTGMYWRM